MQDILTKYKKHKRFTNISIIMTSLTLALWINFLLLDNSNITSNLKANILTENNKKADIYFKKNTNSIELQNSKEMWEVNLINLSLTYSPESIIINDIISAYWEVKNINNNSGFNTIILKTDNTVNIPKNSRLIKINYKEINHWHLNVINANFKDNNNNVFDLTTQSLTF